MNEEYKKIESLLNRQIAISREVLWANIFHDSIKGSKWLHEQNFAPGRAAIGYPTLYALYRILDEHQPKSILELGLGQSTKMIGSYIKWVEKQQKCSHYVVEHDSSWIDFFCNMFEVAESTKIMQMDLLNVEVDISENQKTEITMYENFADRLAENKFDLIFIDGPFGSPIYSRMDIIDLLPQCINDSFIIMLDDAERYGEKKTLKMITNLLSQNGIDYAQNYYSGEKATAIITSQDLHFLCTM